MHCVLYLRARWNRPVNERGPSLSFLCIVHHFCIREGFSSFFPVIYTIILVDGLLITAEQISTSISIAAQLLSANEKHPV